MATYYVNPWPLLIIVASVLYTLYLIVSFIRTHR